MGLLDLHAGQVDLSGLPRAPTVPRDATEMTALYFEQQQLVENTDSRERTMYSAYERAIEQYRRAGGRTLENPYAYPADAAYQGPNLPAPANVRTRGAVRAETNAAMAEARAMFPDLPDPDQIEPLALDRVRLRIGEIERARAVSGGFVPGLLGMAAGAMTDPLNIATLPLGAPARISGGIARQVLRAGLIEGSIAGGTQAAIEMTTAPYRAELGVPGDPFLSIAATFAGGAVLGGGLRWLVGRTLANSGGNLSLAERDAIRVAMRSEEDLASNPLGTARTAEHEVNLAAADAAIRRGEPAPMSFRDGLLGGSAIGRTERASLEQISTLSGGEIRAGLETYLAARSAPTPGELRSPVDEAVAILLANGEKAATDRQVAARLAGFLEETARSEGVAAERAAAPVALAPFGRTQRGTRQATPSLTELVASMGGARDTGGELRDMGLAGRAGFRPGYGNVINNARGRQLDAIGEAAHELGYFDHRPTVAELLDAIDRDHRGQRVYPPHRELSPTQQRAMDRRMAEENRSQMETAADDLGIEHRGLSDEELAARLDDSIDIEREAIQNEPEIVARESGHADEIPFDGSAEPPRGRDTGSGAQGGGVGGGASDIAGPESGAGGTPSQAGSRGPGSGPPPSVEAARAHQVAEGARAEAETRADPNFTAAQHQDARRVAASSDPTIEVDGAPVKASQALDEAEQRIAQAAEIEACVVGTTPTGAP